jgi:O-antigen/teichoic acid export membrane protein
MSAMSIKSTKIQLMSNTLYQLLGKALSMFITVFATVIIAKTYGRDSYGQFSLMQNWPAFLFIIVDFGFNAIAIREIAKDWKLAEKYYNSILYLRLILSFVAIIGVAIALNFTNYSPDLRAGIQLNLLLIVTQALFATTNIIFQAKLRYDLSTWGYIAGYIFILIAVIWLARMHVPVLWLSFVYVLGGLLTFLINSKFLEGFGIHLSLTHWDGTFMKNLFVQSLPLGLMFLFSQINFKSDALIMSVSKLPAHLGYNNNESVALYGMAYKIFEVALVLPTFFMNAAYPILLKNMQQSKEKLTETFTKVVLFLFVIAILTSIMGVLLSPLAIDVIGGKEFEASVLILQLLLGGLIFYYLTQPLSWLIVALDKQIYLPWVYVVAAVVNVVCNLYFIPRYAFYGSALITHLSEFIILIFLLYYSRKAWIEKYG